MKEHLSEEQNRMIEEVLVAELAVGPDQLTPEARLEADLKADSLTMVQITLGLEDSFGFSIPDDRAERVETVADVYKAVAETLLELRRS